MRCFCSGCLGETAPRCPYPLAADGRCSHHHDNACQTVSPHRPQRIQRQRTKGWRMPEGAVYVGRPTKWGNPWEPIEISPGRWATTDGHQRNGRFGSRSEALRWCVVGYQAFGPLGDVTPEDVRRELAGRDLVCWCPLDQPCHADVLLEVANTPEGHS